MNLALLDPFSHNELPEVIEAKLEVPSTVSVCAFNRRGSMLAGGCDNGHVIVWDFETHGVARTLELHEAPVTSVSWTKSSRRLLSSGADGRLAVWDVLGACVVQLLACENLEFTGASTHPLRRDVCLACSSSTAVASREVSLVFWEAAGPRSLALLSPDAPVGEPAGGGAEGAAGGSGGSRRQPPPLVACFDKPGERVLIGSGKGLVTLLDLSGARLAEMQVAGGPVLRSLALSRDGMSFVVVCADRVIRAFALERLFGGGAAAGREHQDVVSRVPWALAAFTSDSEHVIGAAAATEQKLYIWDGDRQLAKMLDGPKDPIVYFAYHPTRPILACCAKSGDIFVWTKQYCENWSAFAPDFKELEENEEYEEREDEFDQQPAQVEAKAEDEAEHIDIVTLEPSELAHFPDADDPDIELECLPIRPLADDDESTEGGAGIAEADAERKAPLGRKRKV